MLTMTAFSSSQCNAFLNRSRAADKTLTLSDMSAFLMPALEAQCEVIGAPNFRVR